MAQASHKRVSGVWKEAQQVWIRVSGVWKKTCIPWIRVSGVWKQCHITHLLSTDVSNIDMDWPNHSYSGYAALTTTHSYINTTLTKEDTGDGTGWANTSVAGGTGSYSFRAGATSDNGYSPRSMHIRITDDDGFAPEISVTLTQQPKVD